MQKIAEKSLLITYFPHLTILRMIVNIFLKSERFFSSLCYTFASRKRDDKMLATLAREDMHCVHS